MTTTVSSDTLVEKIQEPRQMEEFLIPDESRFVMLIKPLKRTIKLLKRPIKPPRPTQTPQPIFPSPDETNYLSPLESEPLEIDRTFALPQNSSSYNSQKTHKKQFNSLRAVIFTFRLHTQ